MMVMGDHDDKRHLCDQSTSLGHMYSSMETMNILEHKPISGTCYLQSLFVQCVFLQRAIPRQLVENYHAASIWSITVTTTQYQVWRSSSSVVSMACHYPVCVVSRKITGISRWRNKKQLDLDTFINTTSYMSWIDQEMQIECDCMSSTIFFAFHSTPVFFCPRVIPNNDSCSNSGVIWNSGGDDYMAKIVEWNIHRIYFDLLLEKAVQLSLEGKTGDTRRRSSKNNSTPPNDAHLQLSCQSLWATQKKSVSKPGHTPEQWFSNEIKSFNFSGIVNVIIGTGTSLPWTFFSHMSNLYGIHSWECVFTCFLTQCNSIRNYYLTRSFLWLMMSACFRD